MKNKKILLVIFTILAVFVFIACSKNTYQMSDYCLELEIGDGDFRILQLSDIHLANKDDRQRQYDFLEGTINMSNADLIVITGDLFTFADKKTAKELFNFLDSFDIPWTVTFGNHDEQCYFSIDWLTKYLNKLNNDDNSNCIFKDILDDEVDGNANFAINLKKNNNLFYQIIMMDSNRYHYGDYIGYDYIHENQIEWYSSLIDYTKDNNGGVILPSMLFFHIPLPEWNDAINALEEGSADCEYILGKVDEKVCSPDYNSGFFDVILSKGSSKAINVGHDHINNQVVKYKGIYLSYCVNSTDRIYMDENALGGTVITIHEDTSLSYEHIIRNYDEYE